VELTGIAAKRRGQRFTVLIVTAGRSCHRPLPVWRTPKVP
jgi:hypothetical protein